MAYDGSIKIDTKIDTAGFSGGMSKIKALAAKGVSAITTTLAGISTALGTGGIAATKVGSDFEAAMSKVSAISGATGEDLISLTDKAKEMGAKTKFTASESAQALQYMSMAGWDTKSMLDGIDGIMNLAAADGLDLATTSDIVTDAITAFGLQASDSSHFADVLAKASSSANTNVSMLGESFKYCAPLAGTMGYSVEDVSLALGLMANASVKGSMAGTSLKTALSNLAAPTKEMKNALEQLGLAVEETTTKVDQSKIDKAIANQEKATSKLDLAQQKYSDAVAKYGESSTQAKSASVNLTTAQQSLAAAEEDLAKAQAETEEQTGFIVTAMQNADGSTKPLKETLIELRKAFSNLDDTQQTQYASTIFGKEAMSGMLAIINASDSDFNKLVENIDSADGSAKSMAETMQDNLQGQITILKSALEGLGIEIYESMQEPLKDAAISAQDYVNRLTKAFRSNGLKGLISKTGNIFAELAIKAAEAAPDMINASVKFIQSFIIGIKNNGTQLKTAAKGIVYALVSGLVSLLPKEVQKPVKTAVEEIKKSFESGGLKEAIKTVSTIIENCGKIINNITEVVLPHLTNAIDFLGDNLSIILPLISGCVAAYKGWQLISTITSLVAAHTVAVTTEALAENAAAMAAGTATAAYSVKSVAVGVLTGKISLATAAQWLWNAAMSANPIGLVIIAVTALAGVIAALTLCQEENISNTDVIVKSAEERRQAVDDEKQSYDKLRQSQKEEADANLAQVDRVKELYGELDILTDSNGHVKDANKDRVNFILKEMNEALGTEYKLTGNQIAKYDELKKSIDEVIASRQAEILLDSNRDVYQQALSNITAAKDEERQATYDLAEAEAELSQYLNDERLAQMPEATKEQIAAWKSWGNYDVSNAKKNIATLKENLSDASDKVKIYTDDINYYEQALVAAEAGNAAEVVRLLTEKGNSYKTAKDVAGKSVEEQKKILGQQYADSLIDLSNYVDKYGKSNDKFHKREIKRLEDQAWKAKVAANAVGTEIVNGTITGLNDKELELHRTVENLYNKVPAWAKLCLGIASPSKVMRKLFRWVGAGAVLGIEDGSEGLSRAAKNMAQGFSQEVENQMKSAHIKAVPKIIGKSSLIAKMKATVAGVKASLTGSVVSNVIHKVEQDDNEEKQVMLRGDIHTVVNIDGRETAIAITPYVSEELAFNI